MIRLQKLIAEAGVASRRQAEEMIQEGRVRVNGVLVTQLGTRADPAKDRIEVDGHPLPGARKYYIAINKPRGVLCTRSDPNHRRILGDLLPAEWSSLYPVGRLDRDSEGLIFMTNDGDFCLRLTHPRFEVRKTYRALVEGTLQNQHLARLTKGVYHEGERLKAIKARLLEADEERCAVELELAEGRYHEVRRMIEAVGGRVLRLKRLKIGPIHLGELKTGRWRTLSDSEVKSLLRG